MKWKQHFSQFKKIKSHIVCKCWKSASKDTLQMQSQKQKKKKLEKTEKVTF